MRTSVSPKQYFNSLNLSVLPPAIAADIREFVLADPRLDKLKDDDEHVIALKELIADKFPTALAPHGTLKQQAAPAQAETPPTPETAAPPTKEVLQAQEGLLKKLLAKDPENKLYNAQLKLVAKLLKAAQ